MFFKHLLVNEDIRRTCLSEAMKTLISWSLVGSNTPAVITKFHSYQIRSGLRAQQETSTSCKSEDYAWTSNKGCWFYSHNSLWHRKEVSLCYWCNFVENSDRINCLKKYQQFWADTISQYSLLQTLGSMNLIKTIHPLIKEKISTQKLHGKLSLLEDWTVPRILK